MKEREDLIISMEGIGSSGKSTQIRLLTEALWKNYYVVPEKIISRSFLENALMSLTSRPKEKIWVAYLRNVEIGVDLLAFMALYKQRLADIKSEVGPAPRIFIIERYLYSALVNTLTRAVLREIAKFFKSKSFAPEHLAELIRSESAEKGVAFDDLVEKYRDLGIKNAGNDIEMLYDVFTELEKMLAWPQLTFIINVPVRDVRARESDRENRAYTYGDILYSDIANSMYQYVAHKDPRRIVLVDGTKSREQIAELILKTAKKRCNFRIYRKR